MPDNVIWVKLNRAPETFPGHRSVWKYDGWEEESTYAGHSKRRSN